MAEPDLQLPAAFSETKERRLVLLLCLLAAVHVFVFSAALPFFNNVDEQFHFDLVVKYSHGRLPAGLEPVSKEAARYLSIYGTYEFFQSPTNFPGGQYPPPPWMLPKEDAAPMLASREAAWSKIPNHETSQPPLYYALAGGWWRFAEWCGFDVYWIRFLNVFWAAALVWLGHAAARLVFPERQFVRLGVPVLLAFMPLTSFYSINNDVLSPVCFGAAFIFTVRFLRAEIPRPVLGAAAGLALAAAFLAKISNLPLVAVSGIVLARKITGLATGKNWRAAAPAAACLAACAGLPIVSWLAWCKCHFGDFTGSAEKIRFLGWTTKPFVEWFHHPIFTPGGFWTFLSGNLETFWQGEILWHSEPLASSEAGSFYAVVSIVLVAVALFNLLPKPGNAATPQRRALWFGFACIAAALAFLGFLSIIYDFHNCFNPSRGHPYFTSGRLLLGALVPFALLLVFGLDRALNRLGTPAKSLLLAVLILFMIISEIAADLPVFFSAYNWFHI